VHALRRHDAASNARTFTPFILQSHQPTMTIREAAIGNITTTAAAAATTTYY